MAKYVMLLFLVAAAGALLVSGLGGVVSRRVATRSRQDVTGGPAVIVGLVLLVAAAAVIWAIAMIRGANASAGAPRPTLIAATTFAGTLMTVMLGWGFTGLLRRRIHVREGTFVGRKAAWYSVLIIACASFEIGLLLFLLAK